MTGKCPENGLSCKETMNREVVVYKTGQHSHAIHILYKKREDTILFQVLKNSIRMNNDNLISKENYIFPLQ